MDTCIEKLEGEGSLDPFTRQKWQSHQPVRELNTTWRGEFEYDSDIYAKFMNAV